MFVSQALLRTSRRRSAKPEQALLRTSRGVWTQLVTDQARPTSPSFSPTPLLHASPTTPACSDARAMRRAKRDHAQPEALDDFV